MSTTNLKAAIDPELIQAYRGTVSLPFGAGNHKRAGVKNRGCPGVESLRVIEVKWLRIYPRVAPWSAAAKLPPSYPLEGRR